MAKEREHAEAILRMAGKGFDALRGIIESDSPELFSDEIFGFHAQQAVEKALKSWIALVGHQYPKSHDLMSLIDVLDDAGEDVKVWTNSQNSIPSPYSFATKLSMKGMSRWTVCLCLPRSSGSCNMFAHESRRDHLRRQPLSRPRGHRSRSIRLNPTAPFQVQRKSDETHSHN
ncbi:MAG: HEPN domain-containing protein [Planctomycetaceae bacterium]|nr:HEPN domain-containing protein [Planctomycetaceae bacterium]